MTDLISRQEALDAIIELCKHYTPTKSVDHPHLDFVLETIKGLPSAEPQWIPVSERMPEERDWYLGIFKEPDTGWINPIPFICDYLLGNKTKATTQEGWILKGFTDREEHLDYYFNLECVAWMPLPEPYEGDKE